METPLNEVLFEVTDAIGVYYEYVLPETQNQIKIATTHKEKDGQLVIEYFYIQRFFDTIYYIKCDRSYLVEFFGNKAVHNPIETVTFNLVQEDGSDEAIFVTHIDAQTNCSSGTNVDFLDLDETDPEAAGVLERLQLGLLTVLVRHCKARSIFDGMPQTVKSLLNSSYGPDEAEKIWKSGMSEKS